MISIVMTSSTIDCMFLSSSSTQKEILCWPTNISNSVSIVHTQTFSLDYLIVKKLLRLSKQSWSSHYTYNMISVGHSCKYFNASISITWASPFNSYEIFFWSSSTSLISYLTHGSSITTSSVYVTDDMPLVLSCPYIVMFQIPASYVLFV